MVMSMDHPELTFTLKLVRSDPTYEQPNQEWTFVSDYSVKFFSFVFLKLSVKLLASSF